MRFYENGKPEKITGVMKPILSVVLPSYNYSQFLPQAIESILSQSYGDLEIILIDDASTDGSKEIAFHYASLDSRIRVFCHSQNLGIAKTVNEGVGFSEGKYVSGLSADDYFLTGFVKKKVEFLNHHPEVGICSSDLKYFHNDLPDQFETIKILHNVHTAQTFDATQILMTFKKTLFWLPGLTSVFRRDLFFKHGPYLPSLGARMDWYLYHKIALFEGAGYIPETLTAVRLHSTSFSSNQNQREMLLNLLNELLDKQNEKTAKKFKEAAILNFLFKPLIKDCLFKPKTWGFYPPLIKKYLRNRLSERFSKTNDLMFP